MPLDQDPIASPPRGGADLECLLSCRRLSASSVRESVAVCYRNGFEPIEGEAALLYTRDPVTPVRVARRSEFSELLATLQPEDISRCITRFEGNLGAFVTPLSLVFEFRHDVLVVSIPEDALWASYPNPDTVDFGRLRRFGTICREVAEQVGAELAFIGTEAFHPEEMRLEIAEASGALPPAEAFSEKSLLSLCTWYSKIYSQRWQF